MLQPLRLLLLSTPVGPLGSGAGGGVELTLANCGRELQRRGHSVQVVAPAGSQLDGLALEPLPGALHIPAQTQARATPITLPPDSVLAAMWAWAGRHQANYDLLVNFAYDWLPFYLTPFLAKPVAHLVSMASLNEAMDRAIATLAQTRPETLAFHSRAQAATFGDWPQVHYLSNAIDLDCYQVGLQPRPQLAWVGRIAPEKALEDAIQASQQAGLPLHVFGTLQDHEYWQQLQTDYPEALVEYRGFLPTAALQQALGESLALLVTPRWLEAFGNVAIEALACGVPVIAYRRGGPAEIVRDGETGFLVEPDSIPGLVAAIARVAGLDRLACRRQAEQEFSMTALGDRLEAWFAAIRSHNPPAPQQGDSRFQHEMYPGN